MDDFQNLEIFQVVSFVLDEMQSGVINIRKNAISIGVPADRMYKWSGRDSKITFEDALKVYMWAKKMDIFPHEVKRKAPTALELSQKLKELQSEAAEVQKKIFDKMLVPVSSNDTGEASQPSQEKNELPPDLTGRMAKLLDIRENDSTVKKESKKGNVPGKRK